MERTVNLEIVMEQRSVKVMDYLKSIGFSFKEYYLNLHFMHCYEKGIPASALIGTIRNIIEVAKEIGEPIDDFMTTGNHDAIICHNDNKTAICENNFSFVDNFGNENHRTVIVKEGSFKGLSCSHNKGVASLFSSDGCLMDDGFRTDYCPECGAKLRRVKVY